MASRIIVVAGPTASGKSALALKLAQELNGELVNADSVQVYTGMNIGSAKLMPENLFGIRQHLIDVAKPNNPIDVAKFVALADSAIEDIQKRGKQAIVVGGSSLYLKALLHGLADLPASNIELRAKLESRSSIDLYEELKSLDLKRAEQLHCNDKVRIVRALESCLLTGLADAGSSQQSKHSFQTVRYQALILCLWPERKELYERINLRSRAMLAQGLVEEVRSLLLTYGSAPRPFQALGYKQVLAAIGHGDFSDDAVGINLLTESIAQATRRFAKQQYTFWRNEPFKRGWQEFPYSSDNGLISQLKSLLGGDSGVFNDEQVLLLRSECFSKF